MSFHHQNCFYFMELLPPANEVWGKVIFSEAPVILFTEGGGLPIGGGLHSGGLPNSAIHKATATGRAVPGFAWYNS